MLTSAESRGVYEGETLATWKNHHRINDFYCDCQCVDGGNVAAGVPKIEDVQSVSITDLRYSTEEKEFEDEESIDLAIKLSNFLRYKPLSPVTGHDTPIVSITYHLKDGSSKSLSANENTVWWQGKAYNIKQQKIFLNLSEGIFFYGEAIAAEQSSK